MKKLAKNIVITAKLLRESFAFAFSSIAANKLRTFLSLLGITIGIFSIITVFTAVDALTNSIESGLASLGGNVIYIERHPWTVEEEGEYQWWKYRQRPPNTHDEYQFIKKNAKYAEDVCYLINFGRPLTYKSNQIERAQVWATTNEWERIGVFEVERGRYFTQHESNTGNNAVIIGSTVANDLFENEDPIGKTIKIGAFKARVVGVLKRQGKSMFSMIDYDNIVMIPYSYGKTMTGNAGRSGAVCTKAKLDIPNSEVVGELKMLMRKIRRLSPGQEDNFAINELSSLDSQVGQITGVLNVVGIVIGGFAMIIGAFGIANIMFVSVKERTNIIGIQKALGAKNYFILTEFLYESVFLSIIGGIIGLLLVYIGSYVVTNFLDFELVLSIKNIIIGLGISAGVGLLAGFIPAYSASRLNPVVAIQSK
ncbi:MAG: ABC transporter permease [Prevotellaceae bacterium]|jgi:putative ABC transport system permease protein|nr:ABC transporter permease [Prevotellaceae bacterium]